MNAFVAMRRFMVQNAGILTRIAHLEKHQIETDEKIDLILDKMDANSPKLLTEQIFATGCVWDAWAYVSDKRSDWVEATIHSRYSESFQTDLQKHNAQQREIKTDRRDRSLISQNDQSPAPL